MQISISEDLHVTCRVTEALAELFFLREQVNTAPSSSWRTGVTHILLWVFLFCSCRLTRAPFLSQTSSSSVWALLGSHSRLTVLFTSVSITLSVLKSGTEWMLTPSGRKGREVTVKWKLFVRKKQNSSIVGNALDLVLETRHAYLMPGLHSTGEVEVWTLTSFSSFLYTPEGKRKISHLSVTRCIISIIFVYSLTFSQSGLLTKSIFCYQNPLCSVSHIEHIGCLMDHVIMCRSWKNNPFFGKRLKLNQFTSRRF